jgi:hypothetical protein
MHCDWTVAIILKRSERLIDDRGEEGGGLHFPTAYRLNL